MIVKNESRIIERALDSVIDLIDCFCIVDTGSTDDTVQKIMNYFEGIPKGGKLGFIAFENFEKTRNEAFQMCKGMSDYVLFLDADMVLKHSIDKNNLTKDYYAFFQETTGIRYHNTRLVKNNGIFYYRGVTHEVILSKDAVEGEVLKDDIAKIIDLGDGGCKQNKLERDKKLLLENLDDKEISPRYYFYLANTLTGLNEIEDAIKNYEKRIRLGGWDQELWCSCYKLGCIFYMKKDIHRSIFYFLEAYNYVNDRVENLYYLFKIYKDLGKKNISNIYLNLALDIIETKDFMKTDLFLEKRFYDTEMFKI